jgi:hypothetical protein
MWITWFLNRGPTLGIFDLKEFTEEFEPRDRELYWFAKYADHVVKYESLQQDINNVLGQYRIRPIKLVPRNVTKGKKKPMSYFTPEILQLFNDKYQEEFTKYGYKVKHG